MFKSFRRWSSYALAAAVAAIYSASASAQFDIDTAFPDPTDSMVSVMTGRYGAGILTVGTLSIAFYVFWRLVARVKRA